MRFASNETRTLTVDGDTVTVKARLSHGEVQDMFTRMQAVGADGKSALSPSATDAIVVAYLVEWSVKDEQGHPVSLRGLTPDEVMDRLRALEQDSALELREAIRQHDSAMRDEVAALKKTVGGATALAPTSQSAA